MNLKQAYSYSVQFLERNSVDEADFKALCVVCSLAEISNSEYPMHHDDFIMDSKLADYLWRLKSGEPLQYVLGKWDFYDSEFYVGKGVLIPRPETEELVELAIKICGQYDAPTIYDLCSGSGCIARTVATHVSNSLVYAVEKSKDAFEYLTRNCASVSNIKLINDDIYNDIDLPLADVIISNPPYIESAEIGDLQSEVQQEPNMALDGGIDGLDFYRLICTKWMNKLSDNGVLLLEFGNKQGESIKGIFSAYNCEIIKDMYGNDRIAVVRKLW